MVYEKIYIDGQWVKSTGDDYIEVENPANKKIIGRVPASNSQDVDRAVEAARRAFLPWSSRPLEDRLAYMTRLLDELEKIKDEMADIISQELGATLFFSKRVHTESYLVGLAKMIDLVGDYPFEEDYGGYIVRREAVGVVAALTPWNYPLGQIMQKLSPALLAGNTLVLKPSQLTPLSAYLLTEAIDRVGFPRGVFNLLPGRGGQVGNALASHRDVDMVSFTGSTEGGRAVGKLAMDGIKKLALELGGKSPAVILEGADYDQAVKRVLGSIFGNTGQSCSAMSRLLVPRKLAGLIEEKILEFAPDFVFGDPRDRATRLGPLASKKQFDKVKGYIERGIEEGAKLLLGEVPSLGEGYYVAPTVFTQVDNTMTIAREEIFGPVLVVIYYDDLEMATELANDTDYGLSAAVFGERSQALDLAKRLRAGEVIINDSSYHTGSPFGGYKMSGIGREGGKYGLEEFLEIKAVFTS